MPRSASSLNKTRQATHVLSGLTDSIVALRHERRSSASDGGQGRGGGGDATGDGGGSGGLQCRECAAREEARHCFSERAGMGWVD